MTPPISIPHNLQDKVNSVTNNQHRKALEKAHLLTDARHSGPIAVNRAEATMDAIEQYILDKRLSPGDPLPTEATLCADLGVSRSSVREALRQLQALDIVNVHQGRGTYVGEMSLRPLVKTLILRSSMGTKSVDSLREVVSVRQILDLGLANAIVDSMQGQHNSELHAIVESMISHAEKGKTFIEEDIAFHSGIVAGLKNNLVAELTQSMWMIHMTAIPELPIKEGGMIQTARAHEEMLHTAEAGDSAAYRAAVRKHYKPLLTLLDEQTN